MKLFFLGIIYSLGLLNLDTKDLASNHAIYVSVLEIESDSDKETASAMVKIFANDLEDAIFNHSDNRLDLLTGNCDLNSELILNYFYDHLQLIIDGNPQKYSFVGCEINDTSLWLTFEFKSPSKWKELAITADYLMELFPTQSNVVSIKYHGDKRMFRMTNSSTHQKLNF
jgi:hypothetical protein